MPLAAVLSRRSSVYRAALGLYAVKAGSDGFFAALARIAAGEAELVGERWTQQNERVVTFRVVKSPSKLSKNGPKNDSHLGDLPSGGQKISIGREFFVSATKDYEDWPLKWWREAVQNSVDAGAKNVDMKIEPNADGAVTVTCADDGSGMDEATIFEKFLVLGATTKTSASGTAGGFGKAKELLLLPWLQWRVHSRDVVVTGAGIDYRVERGPARVGTSLEVIMPSDMKTYDAAAIALVEKSNLPRVSFRLNGKSYRASLEGRNLIEEIPGKASVYFTPTPGEKFSKLIVRAKGLFMFDMWISDVPGHVIVELIAPSIEILSANRDGFRDSDVRQRVYALATKIAKDNLSALAAKTGMIRKKYQGTGKFRSRRVAAEALEQIGPAFSKTLDEATIRNVIAAISGQGEAPQTVTSLPSSLSAAAMLETKFTGSAHLEAALEQLAWEPDFYLINEIEGYKVHKKFFPETMTPAVLKLAKSWVELCRYVFMQLGSRKKFGVGFIFSRDSAAAALHADEEDWLLINPLRDRSEGDIWHPAQDQDLKWLYAAAIHEATHIADSIEYHDESFAAALTRNMARCADGYRKIRQIVAGVRMSGSAVADE